MPAIVDFPTVVQEALVMFGELFDTEPANPGLAFGPYRIARVVPGSQIVLERNPTWWGEPPVFERIVECAGSRLWIRS